MIWIIGFFAFFVLYGFVFRRFKNPYKLYLVFGKKGSGKSTFLVKTAIRYQKKGYSVYTNMEDLCLKDVRIINPQDIGEFVPEENSLLILDEVGMLYDNREFKKFKNETRDFYKLQRHYKVTVYLASQTYDIDKKLRDLTDGMFLVQNIAIVWSLIRPVRKSVTLTEATSDGESRIAENLKFSFLTSWRFMYIPKYAKYFQSFKVPEIPKLNYHNPVNVISDKPRARLRVRGWRKK